MSTAGTTPAREEQCFYSDSAGVRVTSTRLLVESTTYAMQNITSIKRDSTPPSRVGPVVIFLVGALLLLGGVSGSGLGMVIFALLMLAVGAAWWKSQKTTYHLVIASASGEVKAISSEDKQRVDNIVQAVNESIIGRG